MSGPAGYPAVHDRTRCWRRVHAIRYCCLPEQLPPPQQQYQLCDPMGQSRANDLFDLTSTVTDDSDSQFMILGGAIDQHINAMGIDDDPVSTIGLSALNQLFNNVLAPPFIPQPSTSSQ